MEFIFFLIFAIAISFFLRKFSRKIHLPQVISLILFGLIISLPILRPYFVDGNVDKISLLGNIALFVLMFLAGAETSWRNLLEEKKNSTYIAFFGAMIPLFLGFFLFRLFGFSTSVSMIGGVCMSITAEATKARVLIDLGKLKTRLGAAMIGAGIIDDLIGVFIFIIVLLFFVQKIYVHEIIMVASTIAIFFIGVFFQRHFKKYSKEWHNVREFLLTAVIPFFFISLGIYFNFDSVIVNPILLVLVIAVAIFGKIAGSLVSKKLTGFTWKQSYLVGWAMNSRGAIELAIALIAFKAGLIPNEVYSSLIVMALATTLSFPFVIEKIIKNNPKIMD